MTRSIVAFEETLVQGYLPVYRSEELCSGGAARQYLSEFGVVCIDLANHIVPDLPRGKQEFNAVLEEARREIERDVVLFSGFGNKEDPTANNMNLKMNANKTNTAPPGSSSTYPIGYGCGEMGGYRFYDSIDDEHRVPPSWFLRDFPEDLSFKTWQEKDAVMAPALQSEPMWHLRDFCYKPFVDLLGNRDLVAMADAPVLVYPQKFKGRHPVDPTTRLSPYLLHSDGKDGRDGEIKSSGSSNPFRPWGKGAYGEYGPAWHSDARRRTTNGTFPAYCGLVALTDGAALRIAVGQHRVAVEMFGAKGLFTRNLKSGKNNFMQDFVYPIRVRAGTLIIWNVACMHHLTHSPFDTTWFQGLLVHYRRRDELRPCELMGAIHAYQYHYRVPLSQHSSDFSKGKSNPHVLSTVEAWNRAFEKGQRPLPPIEDLRSQTLGSRFFKNEQIRPWLCSRESPSKQKKSSALSPYAGTIVFQPPPPPPPLPLMDFNLPLPSSRPAPPSPLSNGPQYENPIVCPSLPSSASDRTIPVELFLNHENVNGEEEEVATTTAAAEIDHMEIDIEPRTIVRTNTYPHYVAAHQQSPCSRKRPIREDDELMTLSTRPLSKRSRTDNAEVEKSHLPPLVSTPPHGSDPAQSRPLPVTPPPPPPPPPPVAAPPLEPTPAPIASAALIPFQAHDLVNLTMAFTTMLQEFRHLTEQLQPLLPKVEDGRREGGKRFKEPIMIPAASLSADAAVSRMTEDDADKVLRDLYKAYGRKPIPCATCVCERVAIYHIPNRQCRVCQHITTKDKSRDCSGCWNSDFRCRVLYSVKGEILPLQRGSPYLCGRCNRDFDAGGIVTGFLRNHVT